MINIKSNYFFTHSVAFEFRLRILLMPNTSKWRINLPQVRRLLKIKLVLPFLISSTLQALSSFQAFSNREE